MPLLKAWRDETEIPDEMIQPLALFADNPPPALPAATEDEIREVVAFLAGSLKAPRTGLEAGKIKLGAYRLALAGQSKAAIQHAATVCVKTMEWLPAPYEVLTIAKAYLAPTALAHAKANRLIRDRRQREFEETLRKIHLRKLSQDELDALSDYIKRVAETQGNLILLLSGQYVYRNPETIALNLKERGDALKELQNERSKLAREEENGDG